MDASAITTDKGSDSGGDGPIKGFLVPGRKRGGIDIVINDERLHLFVYSGSGEPQEYKTHMGVLRAYVRNNGTCDITFVPGERFNLSFKHQKQYCFPVMINLQNSLLNIYHD